MASWRGRVVIVAGALASIATSRAKWHIDVPLPAAPADPRAAQLTIEASSPDVDVQCRLPTGDERIVPTVSGTTYTYLCPAGGRFIGPLLMYGPASGGGGLCSGKKPEPPAGAFLRVTSLVAVDTWTLTTDGEVPFTHADWDAAYGESNIVVHAAGHAFITIEPSPDLVDLRTSGAGGHFSVVARYRDPQQHPVTMIKVHATAIGTGAPPADSTITIEATR